MEKLNERQKTPSNIFQGSNLPFNLETDLICLPKTRLTTANNLMTR